MKRTDDWLFEGTGSRIPDYHIMYIKQLILMTPNKANTVSVTYNYYYLIFSQDFLLNILWLNVKNHDWYVAPNYIDKQAALQALGDF